MTEGPCFELYRNGCHADVAGDWDLTLYIPVE